MNFGELKKRLSRTLTLILIPHSTQKAMRVNFSVSFLIFLIACWTTVTVFAGYINARHIDYWRTKLNHELIKMKLTFFANRVKETQEYLDQIRKKDEELRKLLDMKTRKAIVTGEAQGGPDARERQYMQAVLSKKIDSLSIKDLDYQVRKLKSQLCEAGESATEIGAFVDFQRGLFHCMPSGWPAKGRITSLFGYRTHPITGSYELHSGLDIASEPGTEIASTCDGTVKFADWGSGYGKLVIVSNSYGYEIYYGHLSSYLVKQGQKVVRGQALGLMGDTGTSTGYHLHYEVQKGGKLLNPARFLEKDSYFTMRTE